MVFIWRKKRILKKYGCVCFCPVCGEILNDGEYGRPDGVLELYTCGECGEESRWYFDAPIPFLVLSPESKIGVVQMRVTVEPQKIAD